VTLDGAKSLKAPRLPMPTDNMSKEKRDLIRGCADIYALKLAHHNTVLHESNGQSDLRAQAALDALEQARCDALGIRKMDGVANNLDAILEAKSQKHGYEGIEQREDIPMVDALHIVARTLLSNRPPPPSAQIVYDKWEPWIIEQVGKDSFVALKDTLSNQKNFTKLACNLLQKMGFPAIYHDDGDEKQSSRNENDKDSTEDEQASEEQSQDSALEDIEDGKQQDDESFDMGTDELLEDIGDTDDLQGIEESSSSPQPQRPDSYTNYAQGLYTVYTTRFDEEVCAEDLADPFEMERLRSLLDQQLTNYQTLITKLANRLQRKLMAKQRRSWEFDLEEGVLDASRLARMIANPDVPLTFKQEKETPFKDTVVTLLIDNSGSMRVRPIAIAATCADIIAHTLERCGLKTEILGFTTRGWKGGKSRELWMKNGRPEKPGRLNDIRHIIYKDANKPTRRTRKNLGLMLKEGLLKENIDGEALVWAYNRIARRPEERKILMMISDGAPVDDSTLSINPSNILEMDLHGVIKWIEESTNIELSAIGIGHDVNRYYSRAITIADAEGLAHALTSQLINLFDEA
ncbi:MAG: cobaltochelatase subunit CobT, partial [Alphaproteobacteria bacterium]|nr:cobaltochelatase subunit CobT [Alphaproteobacteria bacterium]